LMDAGWTVLSPIANEGMRSAETLVSADEPARVVAKLAERKIIVTEKPQGIRVATHLFNNETDIETLVEALLRKA
jgi:selenocysteine lyase/cysteine desulfurase